MSILSQDYPKIQTSLPPSQWQGFEPFEYVADPNRKYQRTSNVEAIFRVLKHDPDIRFLFLPGGQDSCKTVGAMMWQIAALTSPQLQAKWNGPGSKEPIHAFNCAQTATKSDNTVFWAFKDILESYDLFDQRAWSATKQFYTFPNGSQAWFGGPDDFEKAKGRRFHIAYFDEMTAINIEIFRQITQRIRRKIICSWNPDAEFWYEDEFLPELRRAPNPREMSWMEMRLNYLGNERTDPGVLAGLEAMKKNNPKRYRVYGLGETGAVDQHIYAYWQKKHLPEHAKLLCRGLDFGSDEPTALVDIYTYGRVYHVDQILYAPMRDPEILLELLKTLPQWNQIPIICDNKKGDMIDMLNKHGIIARGSKCQGNNQKVPSINIIQGKNVHYTPRSVDVEREVKQYKFALDKMGQIDFTKVPDKQKDHAMDAIRYAIHYFQNYVESPPIESLEIQTQYDRETWFSSPEEPEWI